MMERIFRNIQSKGGILMEFVKLTVQGILVIMLFSIIITDLMAVLLKDMGKAYCRRKKN